MMPLWNKLCDMYEKPGHHGIFDLLDSLRDEIMSLKGFKKS